MCMYDVCQLSSCYNVVLVIKEVQTRYSVTTISRFSGSISMLFRPACGSEKPNVVMLYLSLPAISDAHYVFLTRNCKRPLIFRARAR